MSHDPAAVLDLLLHQPALPLCDLSGGGGLYSLTDETGVVRYIGETGGPFYDRIFRRHCAGDDNSHKFSTVFNAGRFWQPSSRDRNPAKLAASDPTDGKQAKGLRTLFARTRCFARTVNLPHLGVGERKRLEASVMRLAPPENKLWNDARNLSAYEPDGVTEFMRELGWSSYQVEAVTRQKARWDALTEEGRMIVRHPRNSKVA